jgi:parvulin-like peptidyl-prolyl isomerase
MKKNTKKVLPLLALFLVVVIIAISGCFSDKKNPIIAKVGGEVIRKSDLDTRIASYPAQYLEALKVTENKKLVLKQLEDEKLLLLHAKNLGLENNKEIKTQLNKTKEQLMVSMLLRDKVDKTINIDEAALRNYYETHKAEFEKIEERRLSQIVVSSRAEAEKILGLLKKGASFEKLAKEKSIDGTARRGGDLGWFVKNGQLIPELENEAFMLENGKISNIIPTQFGFHIIKVTDLVVRPKAEYEQLKTTISQILFPQKQQEGITKLLTEIKTKYKVKEDLTKL